MQQHQKTGGPLALDIQITLAFNPNERYPSKEPTDEKFHNEYALPVYKLT